MTVSANLVYADVPGFPVGDSVDHVLVSLTGPSTDTQQVAPGTAQVVFSGTYQAGSYTVTAQAFAPTGAALGSAAVSAPFTLTGAPTTITLSLPSAVTVVVA
jgi:hypothetical protein